MDIFDTISRTIDVFELGDDESERLHRIMLMSAVAITIRAVPAPDDFEVGDSEEEFKEAAKVISGIIDENPEVREAIAKHFLGVLESISGGLTEDKVEALKEILEEFRAQ